MQANHLMRLVVLGLFAMSSTFTSAQDAPVAQPQLRQEPLPMDDSLASIVLDDAWQIELLAAEPDIVDPVDATMDSAGNLWVVEMRDYPFLREGDAPSGTVKVLRPQPEGGWEAIEFATGLDMPTGIGLWRSGAVLTVSGAIVYLEDNDGDFVADRQYVLLKGLSEGNEQLRANHPTLRPDGWWYVASGLRGGNLEPGDDWAALAASQVDDPANAKSSSPMKIGARDFRFRMDPAGFEPVTGPSQFGLAFDSLGNRYGVSNRNPALQVVLEQTELAGHPLAGWFRAQQDVLPAGADSRVWPIVNAWTTSNLHAGQYTAACGITIVDLPSRAPYDPLTQQVFVCEPTGSLVSRSVIQRPNSDRFRTQPIPPESQSEWLASTDPWFRPVNIRHAPSGGLLIIDMHRAVIEHPHWVPEELKQRPDEGFGKEAGRIYIVRPANATPAMARDWQSLNSPEIASRLNAESVWERHVAARMLLEQESTEKQTLQAILLATQSEQTILHFDSATLYMTLDPSADSAALALLRGGACSNPVMMALLRSETLRRVSEATLNQIFSAALARKSTAIRLEAALALGRLNTEMRASVLKHNPIGFEAAAAASLGSNEALLCYSSAFREQTDRWLAALLDAAHESAEKVAGWSEQRTLSLADAVAMLAAKTEATSRSHRLSKRSIQQLVSSEIASLRLLAYRVFATEKFREAASINARTIFIDAQDVEVPAAVRIAALDVLGTNRLSPESRRFFRELAMDEDAEVVLAALKHLTSEDHEHVAKQISSKHASVRNAVVNYACSSKDIRLQLSLHIASGVVTPAEIGLDALRRIRNSASGSMRKDFDKFLATIENSDRARLVRTWQDCLDLDSDMSAGKSLFKSHCASCHRIGETGNNIGPDISDSRNMSKPALLVAVLDPNRAVDNNYFRRSILTHDGEALGGIVVGETSQTLTLLDEQAKRIVISKANIDQDRTLRRSLMPEGFETQLSKQQLADIIGYIKNWRYEGGNIPAQIDQ